MGTTVQEQECKTVIKPVQRQQCSTQTKYVPQTTYSEQCATEYQSVCDQVATSVVGSGSSLGGGLVGSSLAGGLLASPVVAGSSEVLRGKREADPQLLVQQPLCRRVPVQRCASVPTTTQQAVSTPVSQSQNTSRSSSAALSPSRSARQ